MKKKEKVSSISLLSRNLTIEGDISGDENFRIDGKIKGTVSVSGDVLIEETGQVEADVSGNNIVIKGTVNGNITAKHRIDIYSTGVMIGDISARSVDIQEGATFEGRSHMMQSNSHSKNNSGATHDPEKMKPNDTSDMADT